MQEPGRSHEDIFKKRHKCHENLFPSAVVLGCVAVTVMCNIPVFHVKSLRAEAEFGGCGRLWELWEVGRPDP